MSRADPVSTEIDKLHLAACQDYAWKWFQYHADQRTKMFNFSLLAAAFIVAGFGTALDKSETLASAIGFTGAMIYCSFIRLDKRNAKFVKLAEDVLIACEAQHFATCETWCMEPPMPPGILRVDYERHPDRRAAGAELGYIETFARLRSQAWRNFWDGKHRVHIPFIQFIFLSVFLTGGIVAGFCPQVIQRSPARDYVSAEVGRLAGVIESLGSQPVRMVHELASDLCDTAGLRSTPPLAGSVQPPGMSASETK